MVLARNEAVTSGGEESGANSKIAAYLAANAVASPCLVMDLAEVARHYDALTAALPFATCHYAVKTNPAPDILRLLIARGACFDAASLYEIDLCLNLGAKPEQILFANTIKKQEHIAAAYQRGIRAFTFDTQMELEKLSRHAPGSKVLCRIGTDGYGSVRPLSRKFGCRPAQAVLLLENAHGLGLVPYGVAFHVGSQQTKVDSWDRPLEEVVGIFSALAEKGIMLEAIDIGGGFPGQYRSPIPPIEAYGSAITATLRHLFPGKLPHIIMEPGRFIVANAGILQAEVVVVSEVKESGKRWVYIDSGKYNGMMETELTEYRIITAKDGSPSGPVVLAGPTCDSKDIIYEKAEYHLPLSLTAGDKLLFLSAGAYTTTYTELIGFNGFEPVKEIYLP